MFVLRTGSINLVAIRTHRCNSLKIDPCPNAGLCNNAYRHGANLTLRFALYLGLALR
jgi:hypothetical protein